MASNKLWRSIALNVLLALGAVVVLLPFVWMLSLSVKPENEISPQPFTFCRMHGIGRIMRRRSSLAKSELSSATASS